MNRLKYERVFQGLSQEALGLAARIDQSELAQIELGRYRAGPRVLGRLAAVLGVPADELLKTVAIAKPEATHDRPRDAAGRYI